MDLHIRRGNLDDLAGLVASSAALFAEDAGTRDPTLNQDWPRREGPQAFRELIDIYAAGSKNWLRFRNEPAIPLRELLPPDAPPESGGLVTALLGIRLTTTDDQERLRLAATVFDLFYNALRIRAERAANERSVPR